jgi:hypothetical protein
MPKSAPDGAGGRSKYAETFSFPGDAQHDGKGPSISKSSKKSALPVMDALRESSSESATRKMRSPMGHSTLRP